MRKKTKITFPPPFLPGSTSLMALQPVSPHEDSLEWGTGMVISSSRFIFAIQEKVIRTCKILQ